VRSRSLMRLVDTVLKAPINRPDRSVYDRFLDSWDLW